MKTGDLNRLITISTLSENVIDGDVTSSWSSGETVRAKVTQVDGSRFMREGEIVDKIFFKIECWGNNYSDNIRVAYNGMILYPVRPITQNPGTSFLNEIIMLMATKIGPVLQIPYSSHTSDTMLRVDSITLTVDAV